MSRVPLTPPICSQVRLHGDGSPTCPWSWSAGRDLRRRYPVPTKPYVAVEWKTILHAVTHNAQIRMGANVLLLSRERPPRAGRSAVASCALRGASAPGQHTAARRLLQRVGLRLPRVAFVPPLVLLQQPRVLPRNERTVSCMVCDDFRVYVRPRSWRPFPLARPSAKMTRSRFEARRKSTINEVSPGSNSGWQPSANDLPV